MERRHRRAASRRLLLVLVALGAGCSHSRQILYPKGPKQLARLKHPPLVRARRPAVDARKQETRPPRAIVTVE